MTLCFYIIILHYVSVLCYYLMTLCYHSDIDMTSLQYANIITLHKDVIVLY